MMTGSTVMLSSAKHLVFAVAGGILVPVLLSGCVERKEFITVKQDGSVTLRIAVSGDPEDMESGAPALARARGWQFNEKREKDDEDKETITRTAETTVGPNEKIPTTDPTGDPEGEALALRHPTDLTLERRRDGVYYHFRRVYEARPWAYINYWRQVLIEEPLERGGDVPPEELADVKKQELVQNIIHFEGLKHLAIARRAAESLHPPLAQDRWLQIHQAVMKTLEAVDTDQVLELLEAQYEESEEGMDGDRLAELAGRLNEQIQDAVYSTLRDLSLSRRYIAVFQQAVAGEARAFAITEDYGHEYWEVLVAMPGRIVAHNGRLTDDDSIEWGFHGRALYDRDIEMMVTSVVPYEGKR